MERSLKEGLMILMDEIIFRRLLCTKLPKELVLLLRVEIVVNPV